MFFLINSPEVNDKNSLVFVIEKKVINEMCEHELIFATWQPFITRDIKIEFFIFYLQDQKNGQNYSQWHQDIDSHRLISTQK